MKEGENAWRAEPVIQDAEAQDPALLEELIAAEELKREHCQVINSAVHKRVARLTIPMVERCAAAHQSYDEAPRRLQERLVIGLAGGPGGRSWLCGEHRRNPDLHRV